MLRVRNAPGGATVRPVHCPPCDGHCCSREVKLAGVRRRVVLGGVSLVTLGGGESDTGGFAEACGLALGVVYASVLEATGVTGAGHAAPGICGKEERQGEVRCEVR